MARCLIPLTWSAHPQRRGTEGEAACDSLGAELDDRLATWRSWVIENGGRVFVERPASPCIYVLGCLDGDDDGQVVVHDREEAFRLLARLRERGIIATLSVRRRRA